MKTPNDLFSRLPSVNDLMENPRIKSLVDRVQEMEVTNGVRQFVERMRREVSRRALDAPIPSISEIADRAARFILGRHATQAPQVVNATGNLWPPKLSGPPLADEALATLSAAAQHYHARTGQQVAELVTQIAGGQAAAIFSSPTGAALLAMSALAEGRPIVVARGELGTMDGSIRLTDLAQQAGVELREVGASDSVSLDDYRTALAEGAGVVLRVEALPHALRDQTCRPEVAELVRLAGEHNAKVVHHIGRGALASLGEAIPLDVVTASASLSAGVALAIARGDGYTGGPACGLAIGRREVVDKLKGSPLAMALAVDPLVESALGATLTLFRESERAATSIPTLALLSTPILNLQSRAERMAAQIESQPGIVMASPIEIPSAEDMGGTRPLPSFGISVLCEEGHLARIQRQLEESRPQIIGNWRGDRLLLDLRTVVPADDISLVTAFDSPDEDASDDTTENGKDLEDAI